MKFTIDNIKRMYPNCTIYGVHESPDPEPFFIFAVSGNTIVAHFDSAWSDDFESTEYCICSDYHLIGKDITDAANEIMDGGIHFTIVYKPSCDKCCHCGQENSNDVTCCNICENHSNYEREEV